MIELYTWTTPNGRKVSIMLEECGLPYTMIPVNIARGDQFKPAFLAISPNNRIPAMVDRAPADGGEGVHEARPQRPLTDSTTSTVSPISIRSPSPSATSATRAPLTRDPLVLARSVKTSAPRRAWSLP